MLEAINVVKVRLLTTLVVVSIAFSFSFHLYSWLTYSFLAVHYIIGAILGIPRLKSSAKAKPWVLLVFSIAFLVFAYTQVPGIIFIFGLHACLTETHIFLAPEYRKGHRYLGAFLFHLSAYLYIMRGAWFPSLYSSLGLVFMPVVFFLIHMALQKSEGKEYRKTIFLADGILLGVALATFVVPFNAINFSHLLLFHVVEWFFIPIFRNQGEEVKGAKILGYLKLNFSLVAPIVFGIFFIPFSSENNLLLFMAVNLLGYLHILLSLFSSASNPRFLTD